MALCRNIIGLQRSIFLPQLTKNDEQQHIIIIMLSPDNGTSHLSISDSLVGIIIKYLTRTLHHSCTSDNFPHSHRKFVLAKFSPLRSHHAIVIPCQSCRSREVGYQNMAEYDDNSTPLGGDGNIDDIEVYRASARAIFHQQQCGSSSGSTKKGQFVRTKGQ